LSDGFVVIYNLSRGENFTLINDDSYYFIFIEDASDWARVSSEKYVTIFSI
tara:strand:+ start:670 stop:822 length:153 start_codon:yes stop_codon:yes gene_type:complete